MNDQPRAQTWERIALGAWILLALGITLRLVFAADLARQNVYLKVFAPAAEAFQARLPLYTESSGFRYPPACAWMLGIFEAMGPLVGSIVWRLCNMAVLFAGVRACVRLGLPTQLRSGERAFLLAVTALLGIGGLNNGQANALMLGCILLAAAAAFAGRKNAPAGLVSLATSIKVYPFAFGMVLSVLRPQRWWTYALGLAAVVAIPYVVAPVDYVTAQYQALVAGLAHEDRTGDLSNAYRDLRLVTAAMGQEMPPLVFVALQGLGGVAIALAAFVLKRRDERAAYAFATGATLCWMLLLGPSTEKVTYHLLAVPLAWQSIVAWRLRARGRLCLLGLALLLVLVDSFYSPSRELQAAQPWLRCFSPWAALLVVVDLAWSVGRTGRAPAAIAQ